MNRRKAPVEPLDGRTPPRAHPNRASSRADRLAARKARTRARRRRSLAVLGVLGALVVSTIVAGWLVMGGSADRSQASVGTKAVPAADTGQQKVTTVTDTSTPEAEATATPEPAPKPEPRPASATPQAVVDAAVPYPGAPAVEPNRISQLKPKHRYIAITIDDGIPYDKKMLDLLKSHDVKVTTFLLGQAAKGNPKMVRDMKAAGFEIANHSWDHPFMTNQSDEEIRSQLNRTQKAITRITGDQAPYFRPPYGDTNKRVKRIAAEEGYEIILWNRSFGDSGKHANASNCYERAIEGIQPGDIVLCHWGKDHTYEAMKRFLEELERRDIKAVTLSELIADSK